MSRPSDLWRCRVCNEAGVGSMPVYHGELCGQRCQKCDSRPEWSAGRDFVLLRNRWFCAKGHCNMTVKLRFDRVETYLVERVVSNLASERPGVKSGEDLLLAELLQTREEALAEARARMLGR